MVIGFELELFLAGALGGLARACYGAMKVSERGKAINIWYFIISIATSAILGGVIGTIFNSGRTVSALIGYVGTDILDNVVSGILPKKIGI